MAVKRKPTRQGRRKTPQQAGKRDPAERSVTVDGNRLTFVPDGPDILAALLDLIHGATRSLRLLYYIYLPDTSGEKVKQALLAALDRGVEVRLLIDGFGAANCPDDYFLDLTRRGANFCRFHPRWGRRYLLRNHQKMALADAGTAKAQVMIGGFNVADDYFKTVAQGGWRDIGLTVAGNAASRLADYYDDLFAWATSRDRPRIRELRRLIFKHSETRGKIQWQLGGPTAALSPWGVSTCRDLVHGHDVEMIAAYFAPNSGMIRRIARAGNRGRARVITAAKSDNTATIAAARFTYNRLLKRGVEVFEYVATKLHSKLVILDDIVHVGSSNLDIRSLYLNMELMLRVDDPGFAQLMRGYFEDELANCMAITDRVQDRRSTLINRIRWAASFFLVTSFDYNVTRRLNFGIKP